MEYKSLLIARKIIMKTKNLNLIKKSIVAFSVTTLLLISTAQAQETADSDEFSFGLKIGGNYANVWDEQGQDFRADGKFGLAAGAFMGIPLGKFLGIQPELLFSQKGFSGKGTLFGTSYSVTRTTNYLDIPIQIQIKPSKHLTLLIGPQYSYLLSQRDVRTFGSSSILQEEAFNNDNPRKNTLGFVFGADINIEKFVLSGRVGWDFQNNHGDGTSSTPRYKNQWLQFAIGFRI